MKPTSNLGTLWVLMLMSWTVTVSGLPSCSQLLSKTVVISNEWKSILTIPVPKQPNIDAFDGWHLKITFSRPIDFLQQNWTDVTLSTVDDRNFIIRRQKGAAPTTDLVLELTAKYNRGTTLDIDTIKYNNVAVCNVTMQSKQNPVMTNNVRFCMELLEQVNNPGRPGEWSAILSIPIPQQPNAGAFTGWHLKLTFDNAIDHFVHNVTGATMTTVDDRNLIMRSPRDYAAPGLKLVLKLNAQHSSSSLRLVSVKYNNVLVCNGSLYHNYEKALSLSLLFLEAQQSGPLPIDNRILWRSDSCMNDRGKNGEDLTGGYFTGSAGNTVKFTFPNAATNTILAWSMIAHKSAYKNTGEYVNGMAAVEWGARYISKCYTRSQDIYAIVGDQIMEPTEFWCRPEDINYPRPTLALSADNPGSDMFGEMVAALASASVVLVDHWEGPKLSAMLLEQARELFELAANNRGDYLRAMQLLTWNQVYVPLNGDECELIWAAVWMYRATSEPRYLQLAEKFYSKLNFRHRRFTYFYWYDKAVGAMILLYEMTKNEDYAYDARIFCDTISSNSSLHTPQGIVKGIENYASGLQLGAWASYACLELGESLVRNHAETTNPYKEFALRQINYILGDSGRSFMIGYGNNYPLRPKHIASLCPPLPAQCDRALFESDAVNYHVLKGALVFGPDVHGYYEDTRRGVHNNVDIIGNAGLTSALAAIVDLRKEGKIPTS